MPINSGRRGVGGVLAIPKRFAAPKPNFANQCRVAARPFRSRSGTSNTYLSGVSRDSTGSPLANCRVLIFRTDDNAFVMETTSDGSGNWSVLMNKGGPFFLVEYKTGAPDVAGTSVNTLIPTPA